MPKYLKGEKGSVGAIPILILLAAVGMLGFLLITNTFEFRDKFFARLFPKPPSHAAQEAKSVPDEILLKFKPLISEKAKSATLNHHRIKVKNVVPNIDVIVAEVPEQAKDKVIEALKHNPNIEYAEPNYIAQSIAIPNDPKFPDQWNLSKILAPGAWDISKGSSSIVVGVIDNGIYSQHEDLQTKIVPGYNFYDNNTDTSDRAFGHGTAVSGVIAGATNNNIGIASLGWDIKIMPLKVTAPDGFAPYSLIATALGYAADHNLSAVNISLAGSTPGSSTLQNAINDAWSRGVVVVAGAGDNGPCSNCVLFPASAINVLAVGGTDRNDARANFSPTGPELDIVAPGVDIYTTLNGGGYGFWSGTSFTAPQVAGLAALIRSAASSLTNQQVVNIITSTADDLGTPGWDDQTGWGRINAYKSLLTATGVTPPPPDTIPPTVSMTSPQNGAFFSSGTFDITANASDNVGIDRVEFYASGGLIGNPDYQSPYGFFTIPVSSVPNGTYTITAKAVDKAGNPSAISSPVTFTINNPPTPIPTPTLTPSPTPTSTPVTQSLTITNITSFTTTTSATITWTTDQPSTSRVNYGTTTSLGQLTTLNPNLVTTHSLTLTGLVKQTIYFYQVYSQTSSGLSQTSSIQYFRTKNR